MCSLSAQLFKITNNTRYLDAAVDAMNFVRNHMYDGHAIVDSVSLSATECATTSTHHSFTTGVVLQALGTLDSRGADCGGLCVCRTCLRFVMTIGVCL